LFRTVAVSADDSRAPASTTSLGALTCRVGQTLLVMGR
jgi:hypothetical protein